MRSASEDATRRTAAEGEPLTSSYHSRVPPSSRSRSAATQSSPFSPTASLRTALSRSRSPSEWRGSVGRSAAQEEDTARAAGAWDSPPSPSPRSPPAPARAGSGDAHSLAGRAAARLSEGRPSLEALAMIARLRSSTDKIEQVARQHQQQDLTRRSLSSIARDGSATSSSRPRSADHGDRRQPFVEAALHVQPQPQPQEPLAAPPRTAADPARRHTPSPHSEDWAEERVSVSPLSSDWSPLSGGGRPAGASRVSTQQRRHGSAERAAREPAPVVQVSLSEERPGEEGVPAQLARRQAGASSQVGVPSTGRPDGPQQPLTARPAEEESDAGALALQLHVVDEYWQQHAESFRKAKEQLEAELMRKFIDLRREERDERLHAESGSAAGSWRTLLRDRFGAAYAQLIAAEAEQQDVLERRVVEQVAIFTEEYKAVLDNDFNERCRRLDAHVAERDRKWVALLADERKRREATDGTSPEALAASARQQEIVLGAVGEAMREVGAMREQLLQDSEAQQKRLFAAFMEKRESLNAEHMAALKRQAQQVESIQQDCAARVLDLQQEIDRLQATVRERELEVASLTAAAAGVDGDIGDVEGDWPAKAKEVSADSTRGSRERREGSLASAFSDRCARMHEAAGAHWESLYAAKDAAREAQLKSLAEHFARETAGMREAQQQQLQELAASYERQVEEVKAAAEQRWQVRLADVTDDVQRQLVRMRGWEATNAQLREELRKVEQQREEAAEAAEGQASRVAALVEETWRQKLESTRATYERLLEAAARQQQGSVSAQEHARVTGELQAARLKLVEVAATHAKEVREESERAVQGWRVQLEALKDEHRQQEEALRAQLTAQQDSYEQRLAACESEWRSQSTENVHALQAHLAHQLAEERAACTAMVTAAHEAAQQRSAAFIEESEASWKSRRADLEELFEQQQQSLAAREDAVRQQQAEQYTALLHKMSSQLQAQRSKLFATLARDQRKLDKARDALAEERQHTQLELQRACSEQLSCAKQQLAKQQSALSTVVFELVAAREEQLLAAREEELSSLARCFTETLNALAVGQQDARDTVRGEVEAAIQYATEVSSEQKTQILAEIDNMHATLASRNEEQCRELLDAHARLVETAYADSAEDNNSRWRALQESVLDRAWRVEEQQRAFEANLRRHCEDVLQAERTKMASAMDEAQHGEARRLAEARAQWESQADERVASLLSAHRQDQQRWEARLAEVASRGENKLLEAHNAAELRAREHRREMEEQKDSLQQAAAKQLTDLEETLSLQTREVRAACEARVEEVLAEEKELRGQLARDLVAVEKRHLARNEAVQAEMQAHFTEQLAALRADVQAKSEAMAALSREQEQRVRESVEAAVHDVQMKYEAFTRTQHDELREAVAAWQASVATMQTQCDEQLHATQQEMNERTRALLDKVLVDAREEQRTRAAEAANRTAEASELLHALHEARRPPSTAPQPAERVLLYRSPFTPFSPATSRESRSGTHTPTTAHLPAAQQYVTASPTAGPLPSALSSSAPVAAQQQQQQQQQQLVFAAPSAVLAPRSVNALTPSPYPHSQMAVVKKAAPAATASTFTDFLSTHTQWTRLTSLWAALETTTEEKSLCRQQLQSAWAAAAPSSLAAAQRATADVLSAEVHRRESQLPLLEAFARRALLVEQAASNKENADEALDEATCADEIAKLTAVLRQAIPAHETQFGHTFLFRGERLMDQLLS